MRVLVTGGTGFLGGHLTRALMTQGNSVTVLGRRREVLQQLEEDGAVPIHGDLRDPERVAQACEGQDVVVHAGALSSPWGPRREFADTNVIGTELVLEGCMRNGIDRLVHISSPSVLFNGRDQEDLTDESPYPHRFVSTYSHTKKLAEDRVHWAVDVGLRAVILRPKAIFGPGDTALLPRLLRAAERGRLPQIGDGRNRVDLTYVDNVVHAILLAVNGQGRNGATYTITNGEPVYLWDVVKRLLAHRGLSTELRTVPFAAAYTLAGAMEMMGHLTGREPLLTRYSVCMLARTQTYNIDAARTELGYEPVVPLETGLERTLDDLTLAARS